MNNSKDYFRQIEILANCLNGAELSKSDYADYYEVSEITINRDLEYLRKKGIQIFSRKGKVQVIEKPATKLLQSLAADYLPVKLNSDVFLKSVMALSKNKRNNFFQYLTLLAKSFNEKLIVNIDYQRLSDNEIHKYEIQPERLFTNEMNWIFQGIKKGESLIKSFHVSRIKALRLTDKKYKKPDIPNAPEENYKMIFRFSPDMESEIMDKIWFENFEDPYKDKDGYIILKTEQPITNKLAGWCISWWDKLEIIEPVELIQHISKMYDSFTANNKL